MTYRIDLTTDKTTGDAESGGPWTQICMSKILLDFEASEIQVTAAVLNASEVRSNALSWTYTYTGADYTALAADIVETGATIPQAVRKIILQKWLDDGEFIGTIVDV